MPGIIIIQQWASNMILHELMGHALQVYCKSAGIVHLPCSEGSITWISKETYS